MKKNGFLTFIFACIPGAGQMYYGYMQRGLSIAMMLILCVMAATVVEPLMFLCLVIWMYSFFDTYDLIRHMAAGEPKEDSLLVLGNYEEIKKLLPQHNRLIGWGLVGIGVWALYDTFISNWLYTLLCNLVGNGYAYDIITDHVLQLLVHVVLTAGSVQLQVAGVSLQGSGGFLEKINAIHCKILLIDINIMYRFIQQARPPAVRRASR